MRFRSLGSSKKSAAVLPDAINSSRESYPSMRAQAGFTLRISSEKSSHEHSLNRVFKHSPVAPLGIGKLSLQQIDLCKIGDEGHVAEELPPAIPKGTAMNKDRHVSAISGYERSLEFPVILSQ